MEALQIRSVILIATSILVAIVLTILPLPQGAIWLRPEWVLLVLIYWMLARPNQIGVAWLWVVGLLMDLVSGTLLGEHALVFSVIGYLVYKFHFRLRFLAMQQQLAAIFFLVFINQSLFFWIQGLLSMPPQSYAYWLSSVTSVIVWPWLYLLLKDCEYRFITSVV